MFSVWCQVASLHVWCRTPSHQLPPQQSPPQQWSKSLQAAAAAAATSLGKTLLFTSHLTFHLQQLMPWTCVVYKAAWAQELFSKRKNIKQEAEFQPSWSLLHVVSMTCFLAESLRLTPSKRKKKKRSLTSRSRSTLSCCTWGRRGPKWWLSVKWKKAPPSIRYWDRGWVYLKQLFYYTFNRKCLKHKIWILQQQKVIQIKNVPNQ